jgi:DNA-binding transcriptional LysR family regulator
MKLNDEPLNSYLLRVFCLVVSERSVSKAALRMNQSQPAISAALKRLRGILADPLLVREKGGLVPTAKALELLEDAKLALTHIDHMIAQPENFDPKTSKQIFRIGMPDYMAPTFIADLVERFYKEIPYGKLIIHTLGPNFDFEKSLSEGELDIVIGNWPNPPPRMHLSMLLKDEIVCLVSAKHPLVKKGMTIEDYSKAKHIVPLRFSTTQRGLIDNTLSSVRIAPDNSVIAQSFATIPFILVNSNLVHTTSRHFAEFYVNMLKLAIIPAPIDFPPVHFYQLWHDRSHKSAGHRWIRNTLTECGKKFKLM